MTGVVRSCKLLDEEVCCVREIGGAGSLGFVVGFSFHVTRTTTSRERIRRYKEIVSCEPALSRLHTFHFKYPSIRESVSKRVFPCNEFLVFHRFVFSYPIPNRYHLVRSL